MASISKVVSSVTQILRHSPTATPFLRGKPGIGKSAVCHQIAQELGIPPSRVLVVHINNHDIVDFTGVPRIEDGMTVFSPPKMFFDFREGTGPGVIVLEEIPQAPVPHQTWTAGFTLERQTSTFKLDPEVRIVLTGNRKEDKSGAKDLLRHLQDRLYTFDVESDINDWTEWAVDAGIDARLIGFLRGRPELLNNFDASQDVNATQRSWTALAQDVPMDMPTDLYLLAAQAKVGVGPGAEWTAARDIILKMPSSDFIRMNPDRAEIPSDVSVRYAVVGALSHTATGEVFERDMIYVSRMAKEFQMVYVNDALRRKPELQQTKSFIAWANAQGDTFLGGE